MAVKRKKKKKSVFKLILPLFFSSDLVSISKYQRVKQMICVFLANNFLSFKKSKTRCLLLFRNTL